MFTGLKNKIREETGSDLSKLTSSWRNGAFLNRSQNKDEPASSASSGGCGDSNSDSISPKLETYLEERLTEAEIRERLRERDELWQHKLDELRTSLVAAQGEETLAAQAVARAAAAEAAAACRERDAALKQLGELRQAAEEARRAQDRLDTLTEKLELMARERAREQTEQRASLSAAEAQLCEATQELALVRACLPPAHPHHSFHEHEGGQSGEHTDCTEDAERCRRERSTLRRQLQETRLALADVKTSWSGQLATLETQVARLSRQAGEEGAERRRALADNAALREELATAQAAVNKLKQSLANSEAKVARLSGEARSLAAELREARAAAEAAAERVKELESRLEEAYEELEELGSATRRALEEGAAAREAAARLQADCDAKAAQLATLSALVKDLQNDCVQLQRMCDREKREKDEALLRNAQMSQDLELRRGEARLLESDAADGRDRIAQLEGVVAQHKENQAACMIIQEKEEARVRQLEELESQTRQLADARTELASTVDELTLQLADKNKKIKTLERTVSDMKKTLARELATGKSELTTAEEAEISRRYLKHVVLRFVTAREEARQLTRALSVLLRLDAKEEAELRAALPGRSSLTSWLPGLSPT